VVLLTYKTLKGRCSMSCVKLLLFFHCQ